MNPLPPRKCFPMKSHEQHLWCVHGVRLPSLMNVWAWIMQSVCGKSNHWVIPVGAKWSPLVFFFSLRSPYASENVAALQKQQNKKLSALLSNLVLTLSTCPQYINCSQTIVSRLVTRAIPSCFKQVQVTSSTTSLHWKRVHQCVKWRNKGHSSQFKPCCQTETPPPELLNSLLQVVLGTKVAHTLNALPQ